MKSKISDAILPAKLPRHIAFIMDGNGRWARKRLLPRSAGHKAGVDTIKKVARAAFDLGIPFVTLYAFSTENKFRPTDEVNALFDLLRRFFASETDGFVKSQLRVRFIGDMSFFPQDIIELAAVCEKRTEKIYQKCLCIALNYGARDEIIRAVNKCLENKLSGVNAEEFSKYLCTDGIPDPDIIVRTGGEKRLSNFLLYQAAYAELFFTDEFWPDFDKNSLSKILEEYAARDRRFGKVSGKSDGQVNDKDDK